MTFQRLNFVRELKRGGTRRYKKALLTRLHLLLEVGYLCKYNGADFLDLFVLTSKLLALFNFITIQLFQARVHRIELGLQMGQIQRDKRFTIAIAHHFYYNKSILRDTNLSLVKREATVR